MPARERTGLRVEALLNDESRLSAEAIGVASGSHVVDACRVAVEIFRWLADGHVSGRPHDQ